MRSLHVLNFRFPRKIFQYACHEIFVLIARLSDFWMTLLFYIWSFVSSGGTNFARKRCMSSLSVKTASYRGATAQLNVKRLSMLHLKRLNHSVLCISHTSLLKKRFSFGKKSSKLHLNAVQRFTNSCSVKCRMAFYCQQQQIQAR